MSEEFEAWVGKQETAQDVVSPSAINRFCATLGAKQTGAAVPYGFHWCLCLPAAPQEELGADGHPAKGNFLPPIPAPRRMWASSAVKLLNPIVAGATIERHQTIAGVTQKKGKTGSLFFVDVEQTTVCEGVEAISERQTLVYRDASTQMVPLPKKADVDLSSWQHTQSLVPNESLLLRYSALTFNAHRIHYDLPYARDVEGYPSLIVHGPLMATLLLQFADRLSTGKSISEFSFRGKKPAFCNLALTLAAKPSEQGLSLAVVDIAGDEVMSATAQLG